MEVTVKKRHTGCCLPPKQQELADFFENAPIAMHYVSPDGMILWANRAELALFGYTRQEYVGRHIAEFYVDQDLATAFLIHLANHETLRDYEAGLCCNDGSIKHVLIDSNVFYENHRFIHICCMTRDITRRQRSEEDLHRRTEELQALLTVANILAGPESFEVKAHKMLLAMKTLSQGDLALLRVPMADAHGLRLVADTGLGVFACKPALCDPIGTSVTSLAYELGQPIVANDYAAHPRALPAATAAGL
jgi:PAS domain S-box-containing protein